MARIPRDKHRSNRSPKSLPLFEHADRRRWDGESPATRMVRRHVGTESAATARTIAELAGFPVGGDR